MTGHRASGPQVLERHSEPVRREFRGVGITNDSRHDQLLPAGHPGHDPEGVEKRFCKVGVSINPAGAVSSTVPGATAPCPWLVARQGRPPSSRVTSLTWPRARPSPRGPFLAYFGRTRNMDVYIRARPVAESEARFPPLHQEPGTGARSCPRGPGFLVAPGHRARSGVCPRRRPAWCEPNHWANCSASTWSGAVSAPNPAATRVLHRRPFAAAMAWSTVW